MNKETYLKLMEGVRLQEAAFKAALIEGIMWQGLKDIGIVIGVFFFFWWVL